MAGSLWASACRRFWSESVWLPEHLSWDSMKNTNPNIYKPQLSDLLSPVYLCAVICVVRIVFERLVEIVVGRLFKLRSKVKKASHNPAFEMVYAQDKSPRDETVQKLSKQTDVQVRQIERWFRIRRNQDRTPVMKKFCESSWRCMYYAVLFVYGLYTLWNKPWLWDTNYCWKDWPEHHVSDDVYWYYSVQAGFYMALSLSLFTDHKRKDFMEMIVHHFATLGLMFLSWMVNFTRVGTLVLLLHDCVDPIMEAAKMAKYLKKEALCTFLFVCFMLTWVMTRMTLYPFRIIRSTLFESGPYTGEFYMYYAFNVLLITLQVLHIIWFYFILLIAKDGLTEGQPWCVCHCVFVHVIWFYFILLIAKDGLCEGCEGQVKKDSRSSDESISEKENDTPEKKRGTPHANKAGDKNGLKMLDRNGLSAHRIRKK